MGETSERLYGWGYQGQSIADLLSFAMASNIEVVVDVRLNPMSRKKGFSKRALNEALAAAHLIYLHRPALGNPRDNREAFASPGTTGGRAAHERFREEVLASTDGDEAIRELVLLLTTSPVALLCWLLGLAVGVVARRWAGCGCEWSRSPRIWSDQAS